MRLEFDSAPSEKYPYGYWYAQTNDGGHDADGASPIQAVTKLAQVLEAALYEERRTK